MLLAHQHLLVMHYNIMTEQEIYKIIGYNIKKYRKQSNKKLTQKELAKRIGVCTSLIGSLESNNINQGISVYNLYKISKVLNISIDKLIK